MKVIFCFSKPYILKPNIEKMQMLPKKGVYPLLMHTILGALPLLLRKEAGVGSGSTCGCKYLSSRQQTVTRMLAKQASDPDSIRVYTLLTGSELQQKTGGPVAQDLIVKKNLFTTITKTYKTYNGFKNSPLEKNLFKCSYFFCFILFFMTVGLSIFRCFCCFCCWCCWMLMLQGAGIRTRDSATADSYTHPLYAAIV